MRKLVALIIVCGLSGCASSGTQGEPAQVHALAPDPHRFGELVAGVSTRDEAEAILGPPNAFSDIRGQILLQWIDVYAHPAIHLAILFGHGGRMVKIQSVTLI
jgi:hypothetical protein